MQKNKIFFRQVLCVLLSVVFVATMLSGCNNNENGNSPSGDETTSISKLKEPASCVWKMDISYLSMTAAV